mmetsp:Transcript_114482/g.323704  ORF Transcript_114482/g.323704 Transcript_114482/m.323704 type:complete len:139 (+) Transcript_114482:67-483(+)
MALLAAGAACSAPCAGTVAAVTGGTIAGPVALAAVTAVTVLPLAKRALRNFQAKTGDVIAVVDSEAGTDNGIESEEEAISVARITTTVGASRNSSGGAMTASAQAADATSRGVDRGTALLGVARSDASHFARGSQSFI